MKACLDYITPAQRLAPHAEHKNCTTLEEANAYREARGISLRLGSTFEITYPTDVASTWARACPNLEKTCTTPMFLRRQAA
jgi:hypothetical protein